MRVLLDTHAFLWWVNDAPELSRAARRVIADSKNECLLSVASCWEMAIKVSFGKLQLSGKIERFLPEQMTANGIRELAIEVRHATRVSRLPFHHRDPFDRLLAAQALEEELTIVSADRIFKRYGIARVW
jgi:PIN domain nuclease of toxin-antitoxin system